MEFFHVFLSSHFIHARVSHLNVLKFFGVNYIGRLLNDAMLGYEMVKF